MKRGLRALCLGLAAGLSCTAFAQTQNLAEEQENFGNSLKWIGIVDAQLVLNQTCVFPPGEELPARARCVVLQPAPAQTFWEELEVASVRIPGGTLKTVICPVFLHNTSYGMSNPTAIDHNGRLTHRTFIVLESEALQGVNHLVTGEPFNGKLEISWGNRTFARRFTPGDDAGEVLQFTRACNAGIDSNGLVEGSGVPEAVVKEIFKKPLVIHLSFRGNARLVDFGNLAFSMRVMGN